jgi:hypothetical protein
MKRTVLLTAALLMLVLTGCADSHEKVLRDKLACMKEFNAQLDTVKDEAGALRAAPQAGALALQMESILQREQALRPTGKERDTVYQQYGPDIDDAGAALSRNLARIAFNEKLRKPLDKALETFSRSLPPPDGPPDAAPGS